jgi:hypothetical protein
MLAAGGGAIVIVPGGGPFADQAGGVQMRRRFDDAMALPRRLPVVPGVLTSRPDRPRVRQQ